jgi:hypothetical protein
MVAITIRDVPPEVRNELAQRAERAGQSLQQYLRFELQKIAEKPSKEDWMRRVRAGVDGSGVVLSAEDIVRSIREDRDDSGR